LPKPITTTKKEEGAGNELTWNVCSMQGWRVDMEDAHIAKAGISEKLQKFSLFAVFDGHAGKQVAEETAKEFTDHLSNTAPFSSLSDGDDYNEEEIKNGIQNAFRAWDKRLREMVTREGPARGDRSGSTATGVLITPKHYFFFNAGDSRTILVRNSKVEFASMDHKPTNPEEKKRIEEAGGRVMIQRINGSLAVSRALGDFEYKTRDDLDDLSQLVSPMPDITCVDRDCDCDNYILVACDGIYDVMQNDQICEFLTDRLYSYSDKNLVPETLIDLCLNMGSRDNMSAVLVNLNNCPQPDETKVQKEKDLNDKLIEEISSYLKNEASAEIRPELNNLIQELQEKDFIKDRETIGGMEVLKAKLGFISRQFDILKLSLSDAKQ